MTSEDNAASHPMDASPGEPVIAPIWLSNGTYGALLTPSGTGFSCYRDFLLSSWNDDPCEDDLGPTIYLRDPATGAAWSACGAPLPGCDPGTLTADPCGASLRRRHDDIESLLRLEVLAELPAERRLLGLTNRGATPRDLEVTAYLEVVLNHPDAHAAHPGFSKLFVQTRWQAGHQLLIATRRPRANAERNPAMALGLTGSIAHSWETDRARFLGRGRGQAAPRGLTGALSGSVGNVLDPVLALRTRVVLAPGEQITLAFITVAADEPDQLESHFHAAEHGAIMAAAHPPPAGGGVGAPEDEFVARLVAAWSARTPGVPTRRALALRPKPGTEVAPLAAGGNGYGEFTRDGREYRIRITRDAAGALRLPPMPWTNVIANERFGVIASEKGALSTFAGNSRLHRITPWRNDPVVDPHDEALYLRDASTGAFWSLLPGPAPAAASYDVRHGFGYSVWQHQSGGLEHEVTVFVPRHNPLRIADIKIRNAGLEARRVALYAYNRWVLGATNADTRGSLEVGFDAARIAILARNPAAGVFSDVIGFAALVGGVDAAIDACTDRAQFLGRPGFADAPAAVRAGGSLPAAAGPDQCAALRVELDIPPAGEIRIAALLGEATSIGELDLLLATYRTPGAVDRALAAVREFWAETLGTTQVHTPAATIDLMVNGWLAYQTIVCRLWARSAYYQSGGAFGFRDQLQDAAALAYSQPELLREQLLRSAAHQFAEGDVLHWWHPPENLGIRTRFADDLVWLPYLAAHYVQVTGDRAILDVTVPFLAGPSLEPGEDERYFMAGVAETAATLYRHCVRALERAMTCGAHGLPLFGCGDWNDGMNRVGREGRGESVWMALFLYAALGEFLPISRSRGDAASVAHFEAYRGNLLAALDRAGWDGEWYRRGYYDNGAPLGSRASDECKIDALAQAWAVIAKVAPAERVATALDSVERHLISDADRVIRLLAPPFDRTPEDPGYIKGYVAGVRENGGQYTHAALWVVRALAEAGRRDRAAELLAMLSPVSHSIDAASAERYQVEPYVIAADVYGVAPHVGRGGWTWYTGSAGWMLRVALESVLGLGIEDGTTLTLAPCIPDAWPGFQLTHRRPDGTCFQIDVANPKRTAERVVAAAIDGVPVAIDALGLRIPLAHDGRTHLISVTLGPREPHPAQE